MGTDDVINIVLENWEYCLGAIAAILGVATYSFPNSPIVKGLTGLLKRGREWKPGGLKSFLVAILIVGFIGGCASMRDICVIPASPATQSTQTAPAAPATPVPSPKASAKGCVEWAKNLAEEYPKTFGLIGSAITSTVIILAN